MNTTICAACKTRPATVKRGSQVVCADCYSEKPLPKPGEWDRVINPAFIAALETRLSHAEARIAVLESILGNGIADS